MICGEPEHVAMRISVHKTRSVFDRYDITSERDLRDAARRLGDHIDELKKHVSGETMGPLLGTPNNLGKETGQEGAHKLLN